MLPVNVNIIRTKFGRLIGGISVIFELVMKVLRKDLWITIGVGFIRGLLN